jgi:hypothetical protein
MPFAQALCPTVEELHEVGFPLHHSLPRPWKPAIIRSIVVINCTWREALDCSVWIDFHIYMSGLGLIYLAILRWSNAHLVFGLETNNNNHNNYCCCYTTPTPVDGWVVELGHTLLSQLNSG